MSLIKEIGNMDEILDDVVGYLEGVLEATCNNFLDWNCTEENKIVWEYGKNAATKRCYAAIPETGSGLMVVEHTYCGCAPWEEHTEADLFLIKGETMFPIFEHLDFFWETNYENRKKVVTELVDEIEVQRKRRFCRNDYNDFTTKMSLMDIVFN